MGRPRVLPSAISFPCATKPFRNLRTVLLSSSVIVLESIIVVVIGATKGGFGYHGIEAAVVQKKAESGTEIGNSLEFDFVVPPLHS